MVTMTDTIDIRGFLPNSLNEWEGHITAVVFTARCNWRCPYCHGWRLVTEPDALPRIDPEEIFATLEKQRKWIDGVAITGGEPTLQPGLVEFIRDLHDMEMPVKLETNGTHPEVIEQLLNENLLACLCMDYKAPLDDRLAKVTCVTEDATAIEKVKKSFALAAASGIEREYHTTLCPAFIDETVIEEMARALEPGGLWILQQYETDEVLDVNAAGTERFDVDTLKSLEAIAKRHHKRVLLRSGKGA